MEKFVKFSDWESKKYSQSSVEEETEVASNTDAKQSNANTTENAGLIAQLSDVEKARKEAIRNKDTFQSQILEIEAKLLKLSIERNDLSKRKADLELAKTIAAKTSKEGKTNVKEN
jgi:hypothetical protein